MAGHERRKLAGVECRTALSRRPVTRTFDGVCGDSVMRFYQGTVTTRDRIAGEAGEGLGFVTALDEPYINWLQPPLRAFVECADCPEVT
jgi:hypothetical protein